MNRNEARRLTDVAFLNYSCSTFGIKFLCPGAVKSAWDLSSKSAWLWLLRWALQWGQYWLTWSCWKKLTPVTPAIPFLQWFGSRRVDPPIILKTSAKNQQLLLNFAFIATKSAVKSPEKILSRRAHRRQLLGAEEEKRASQVTIKMNTIENWKHLKNMKKPSCGLPDRLQPWKMPAQLLRWQRSLWLENVLFQSTLLSYVMNPHDSSQATTAESAQPVQVLVFGCFWKLFGSNSGSWYQDRQTMANHW